MNPLPKNFFDEWLGKERDYWLKKLSGDLAVTSLPIDFERSEDSSNQRARIPFDICPEAARSLLKVCSGNDVLAFTIFVAALKICLYKYVGSEDIIVGTAIHEKYAETSALNKVLVLRDRVSGDVSVKQLLSQIKNTVVEAYSNQKYPFQRMLNLLKIEAPNDRTPLFDIAILLENINNKENLSGIKNDITLIFSIDGQRITGEIEYRPDLFRRTSVQIFQEHYRTILGVMLNDANKKVGELRLLPPEKERQLLFEFNKTTPYPRERTIPEIFEAQAARAPFNTAVVFQAQSLTYYELNGRANQLAHYLRQAGVGPEVPVAILMDRSPELIVAMLAVIKAGGAYVPIDPTSPKDRLGFMLEDSRIRFVLTQSSLKGDQLIPDRMAQAICVDTEWDRFAGYSQENPPSYVTPDNLIYVMYTSGSTGKPKAICITHRAVNWFVSNLHYVDINSSDAMAHVSNPAFDAATFEVWATLTHGGRVVVIEKETVLSPSLLARELREQRISVIFLTSQLFARVASHMPSAFETVGRVLAGGEALDPRWAREVLNHRPPEKLINGYGPTETTVFATTHCVKEVEPGAKSVPIGRAIDNAQVYILNEDLQLVPVGVSGEIYISGDGLARGYLNRPDLTAERFIPDPNGRQSGTRMYTTGDVGRHLPDGTIEYTGRTDYQVKIRGFRIELGEIETIIKQQSGVRDCVIVVLTEGAGEKRLAAYVVIEKEHPLRVSELKQLLKQKLPEYMLPATFVRLEAIPLTANGKVDRQALPAVDQSHIETEDDYQAPRSEVEKTLAAIWQELLGLERVGVYSNFFDIGGHSLLATTLMSRVLETFQVEINWKRFFYDPTISGIAETIDEETATPKTAWASRIERADKTANLPLSFAQQRLWFLHQLEPDNPFYNVPMAMRLKGKLDVAVLERSVNAVINRHEILRTTFPTREGQPVQLIAPASALRLSVNDLTHVSKDKREGEVLRLAAADARQSFDLARGPVFRTGLLQLDDDEHVLLLNMHHIVADGWSMGILIHELNELYNAFSKGQSSPLPDLSIQYSDYAVWQRQWLQGEVLESQLRYWKNELTGAPLMLELPTDRPRPAMQGYSGASEAVALPETLSNKLRELSSREEVTLFMTMLSAYKVLLQLYTGQDEIIVGGSIANRNRRETEPLIGFFVNMLVLRTYLGNNPTFEEVVRRVRELTLGAYAHQDLPFEKLVEELQPERDLSRNPLFQAVFNFQNEPMRKVEMEGLEVERVKGENRTSHFDLMMYVADLKAEMVVSLQYNTDLFERSTISRMLRHFQNLLEGIADNPERHLAELPLMSESEMRQMIEVWNDTQADYPKDLTIHKLFEAQAEETPVAVALEFGPHQMNYDELNRRSNQMARYLRGLGVKPGARVGIYLEHSIEAVLGILGVLKAGGCCLLLDPSHPEDRVNFMLKEAGVTVLLTQQHLKRDLSTDAIETVCPDSDWGLMAGQSDKNPNYEVEPGALAYIIYTSGSTGLPKGVKVRHSALTNYVWWAGQVYRRGERLSFPLYSSLAFDLTLTSIFTPLITGGRIVIYRKEGKASPLFEILRDNKVDVIKLTPSHLSLIKDMDNSRSRIKRMIVGGELFNTDLARQVTASFGGDVELFNEYGPTEATVGCMIHRYDSSEDDRASVAIGRPAANTRIYILNKHLRPVPSKVIGELYISGDGLADGYVNGEVAGEERFFNDPFAPGKRMYKTGDLARWLEGGVADYIGRRDKQVKFHGYRVELNEIKGALNKHPQVDDSVVTVAGDKNGNQVMIGYYVSDAEVEPTQLRNFLKRSIIEETIPNLFVRLPVLPLTPNGKVDYERLPKLEDVRLANSPAHEDKRTETEEMLTGIWAEVLGLERVGTDDDFFGLGGHSLMATQVLSRMATAFQVDLPMRSMFDAPTIAKMAKRIDIAMSTGRHPHAPRITPAPRDEDLPLSYAQQRLWFLYQLEPDNPFYNVPMAIRLRGELDVAALERSIGEILNRHETLRTTFMINADLPVQVIAPKSDFHLPMADLCGLPVDSREREAQRLSTEDARRPFDLARARPIRTTLLRLDQAHHMLLITMHHIVSDAWSLKILNHELTTLYRAFHRGERSPLPELPVQYADFAIWQREWLRNDVLESQLQYWRGQLEDMEELDLPLDYPRSAAPTYRGDYQVLTLPGDLSETLRSLSRKYVVSLSMTMLSAYKVLLQLYTGQDEIIVGGSIANRNRRETEPLIGFFVNMLVLRTYLGNNPTFEEVVRRVRELTLGAYAHQDLPFEKLVEELQPERDLSRNPLFQAVFNFQNEPMRKVEMEGLEVERVKGENRTSHFDLMMYVADLKAEMVVSLQYNTDLFERSTISRMLRHFEFILRTFASDPQRRLLDVSQVLEDEEGVFTESINSTSALEQERFIF